MTGQVGTEGLSIQERLYPTLPCFGCGHGNPKGLRLRSYPAADTDADTDSDPDADAGAHAGAHAGADVGAAAVVVAQFTPWPEHDNGLGYLNGGIISTVLDCHSAAAVTHAADVLGWPALPGAALPYVTAGLDVRFLRPAPLYETVELRAVVVEASEAQMRAEVELRWDGKPRAQAQALWKRWRPR